MYFPHLPRSLKAGDCWAVRVLKDAVGASEASRLWPRRTPAPSLLLLLHGLERLLGSRHHTRVQAGGEGAEGCTRLLCHGPSFFFYCGYESKGFLKPQHFHRWLLDTRLPAAGRKAGEAGV